jgi:hypothetical protein
MTAAAQNVTLAALILSNMLALYHFQIGYGK